MIDIIIQVDNRPERRIIVDDDGTKADQAMKVADLIDAAERLLLAIRGDKNMPERRALRQAIDDTKGGK